MTHFLMTLRNEILKLSMTSPINSISRSRERLLGLARMIDLPFRQFHAPFVPQDLLKVGGHLPGHRGTHVTRERQRQSLERFCRVSQRCFGFTAVLLLTLLLLLLRSPVNAQQVHNILVLHSYHQGLQWTDSISAGIQSELELFDNGSIEVHFEYLDTKRNTGEAYFRLLVDFERQKKQLTSIDFKVIIAADNNALRFMMDYGQSLFPDVPVVFCGVNNFKPSLLRDRKGITGVVEAISYGATLDLMHKLHPKSKRVLVVLDRTPTGNAIKSEFEKVAVAYSEKFDFQYYQDFVLDEVPGTISKLADDTLIYILTFNRDRDGRFISYVDGISMIHQAAKVPIYGSWEFYFGNGIVGGMITSGHTQGQRAGRLAREILAGRDVQQVPIITQSPNRYMFDYVEMQRYGIKKSQLPEASIIINEPPSFYVRYKKSIITILILACCGLLFLVWRLVVQRQRQQHLKAINVELDRRVAEQTHTLKEKNLLLNAETKRLEAALDEVKTLSGLLPICCNCKKIRDDKGYWYQIESYIMDHSNAEFSHSICQECTKELYPDFDEDEDN